MPIKPFLIEQKAESLLNRFGICQPNFDIEALAVANGLKLKWGNFKNVDGLLTRKSSKRGVIRLNQSIQGRERLRFIIAHELGHWELHPDISQGFVCTAKNLDDYVNSQEEIEANSFAASLMIPRSMFNKEYKKRDPDFSSISALARTFGTTLTTMTRRYVELVKEPVIAICSVDNKIWWFQKNNLARKYFIECGKELPRYSLTRGALLKEKNPEQPEPIHPNVWFTDWRFSEDAELFEDVRIFTKHGSVLTLLWVCE